MNDSIDNHQIDQESFHSAMCELLKLNWFIADTSRLMQLDTVMDDERIVTYSYRSQLAEAIEAASNKVTSLHEVVEKAIGIKLDLINHKYPVGLFNVPEDG